VEGGVRWSMRTSNRVVLCNRYL